MIPARATNVTHQYGSVTALDSVDLDIHAGELLGVGVDGAAVDVLEVPFSPSEEEAEMTLPADITRVDLESGKESPVVTVVR